MDVRTWVSECAQRLTCRDADEDKRGEKRQDDTSEAPAVSRAPVVSVRATLPKRPASHRAVCHHAGTKSLVARACGDELECTDERACAFEWLLL